MQRLNEDSLIALFRFGKQKWQDQIIAGKLSFSCVNSYIEQAEATGNDEQGDRFEAVFARLKLSDTRIEEMKKLLGNDLEIIDDGDYKLLRRKSARFRPVFCLYGYHIKDVFAENDINSSGKRLIKHELNAKMYSGFSDIIQLESMKNVLDDTNRMKTVFFANTLIFRTMIALTIDKILYKIGLVNYDEFGKETFFIEPTNDYNELLYKFPRYKYQHEVRIWLPETCLNHFNRRFYLDIKPLAPNEYLKIDEQVDLGVLMEFVKK
ncbi:MAG: hypothetical protein E7195_01580 [Peptococcaceae bacterium]|nr:hypothetical protein [Peptococcaceae bacterium]